MTDEAQIEIRDNERAHRFEAWADGELAGFAKYWPHADRLVFTHTEIDPAFEGRGIGSRLAAGALDSARERGLGVEVRCPFIAAYIDRHPAYRDLVVPGEPPPA